MRRFDLTHPLGPDTPVFPGDEPVRVRILSERARGDPYTARRLDLGTHSGTHVDAPSHVVVAGSTVDRLSLSLWVGPAYLLDREALAAGTPEGAERLLLAHVADGLSPEEAEVLARAGVRLLGVDGPSVDSLRSDDLPVHRRLLGAGVALVEYLRLEGVPRGWGTLYCLPLAVGEGDGAPCRVLWDAD